MTKGGGDENGGVVIVEGRGWQGGEDACGESVGINKNVLTRMFSMENC